MLRCVAGVFVILIALAVGSLGLTARRMSDAAPPQASVRIERLEGALATAHIQKVLAGNPEIRAAYARAEAQHLLRGFKKANTPLVIKQRRIKAVASTQPSRMERIIGYLLPKLLAQNQYGESTAEGEIFMDPWDDGNNVTWEGTFYVTRYSDGAWTLYDWQNDTRQETEYYMHYATREGGFGDNPDRERAQLNIFERIINLIEPPVHAQYRFWQRAKSFGVCYSSACLGAATACALSGPAWGPCTGAWCTGAAVTCGIANFLPI